MTLAGWLAALAVGLLAGSLSGLAGIGGGVVMVPFLYLLFAHPDWFGVVGGSGQEAVLAHATSLFVIVPTSLRGTWLFHRAGLVEWRAVGVLGVAAALAAAGVAAVADRVPGPLLRLAFALFLVVTGAHLWSSRRARAAGARGSAQAGDWARGMVGGLLVGGLSALLGVGGGIVAIPVLLYALSVEVKRLAATSLAVVMVTATAGTLSYALAGIGGFDMPRGAVGYVYLPAAIALAAGTLLSVGWGTYLNRRLPADALRRVFAVIFFLVALVIASDSLAALRG